MVRTQGADHWEPLKFMEKALLRRPLAGWSPLASNLQYDGY